MNNKWKPNSWRDKEAKHIPKYKDKIFYNSIFN